VADDAFTTLRTVRNVVEGYGPRWNEHERVQTFTHPLWMLLVSAVVFVTREAYFTTLAVSIGCSLAAVTLLLRRARSAGTLLVCAMLLVSSRAFVDYSTSGLENPLTHLCLRRPACRPASRPRPARCADTDNRPGDADAARQRTAAPAGAR
jgi:arabinofuranosyltransferase